MDRFGNLKKLRLLVLGLFMGCSGTAQKSVELVIGQVPESRSKEPIYVAGSFNGWNPGATKLIFDDAAKLYKINIPVKAGDKLEYKFTRGTWNSVETNKDGSDISNRILDGSLASDTVEIDAWKDDFATGSVLSTAHKNVMVLDSMYMPQLKRNRIIRLYLPEGYDSNKAKRYPVLYMHDGQNLFDASTAAYGEWNVDEALASMAKQCIVVGIDNGPRRINEYNPYHTKRFGTGEGPAYTRFIVETLKPYIDKHYRTLRDRQNTAIAGSSMGGLISMYAVLKYPNVFGSAGVFSPSFWIAPKIYTMMSAAGKQFNNRVYLYAGDSESAGLVNELNKAEKTLLSKTHGRIAKKITKGAGHNEKAWSQEFPAFYKWWINR